MKLFNPGGERGSAMSYAALLEKIEIMRSTLRWATRIERPDIEKLLRQANTLRDEVMQLSHKERFVQAVSKGAADGEAAEPAPEMSTGERRRVLIARALYHDPRLLVFDEATSALDTQSESNIMANMEAILAGRTAVIIAHRLSTIMRADKIVVLYEGKVVEQGRHEELLARRGMYFELVQKQLGAA